MTFYLLSFVTVVLAVVALGLTWHRWGAGGANQWEERRLLLLSSQSKPRPENADWVETMSQEGDRFWGDPNLVEASIRILIAVKRFPKARLIHGKARAKSSQEEWFKDLEVELIVIGGSISDQDFQKLEAGCFRQRTRTPWKVKYLETLRKKFAFSTGAAELLGEWHAAENDPKILALLAEFFLYKKQYDTVSQAVFAARLEMDPGNSGLHKALARCLELDGDLVGMDNHLQIASQLEPANAPGKGEQKARGPHPTVKTPPKGTTEAAAQGFLAAIRATREGTPVPKSAPSSWGNSAPTLPSPPPPPPRASRATPPLAVSQSSEGFPSRYRQLVEIGRGGMGVVYKAFDNNLQRWVAIKTFQGNAASQNPDMLQRFLNESRIMASLDHPSIPKVFDLSVTPPYYLAFEFIEGDDLRKLINLQEKSGPPPLRPVLELGVQMAGGFHHAASKGILHRDIKPENILMETEGRIRIIDFGLAHFEGSGGVTQVGVVVGTPWYMAPERMSGNPATVSSEIYAFGFTMFELLTNKRPFPGDTFAVIFARDPIPLRELRPDAPVELEVLLSDCLNKNPFNRPASFEEVGLILEQSLGSSSS